LRGGERARGWHGRENYALPASLLPRGPIGAVLSLVVKEILGSFWVKKSCIIFSEC